MVPFYGQGMNSGFEDCLVLDQFLDHYSQDRTKAFQEYTLSRHPDLVAICDLSMYNYLEMRSLTTSKRFLFRKQIDDFLYRWFPYYFVPLYDMIAFTQLPYSQAVYRWHKQTFLITTSTIVCFTLILFLITYLLLANVVDVLLFL
jgi:kynurenine 3-monooxygenase